MLTDPFGTNHITKALLGCAIRVHEAIGPGLFEQIYNECLQYELKETGLSFELNRPAPVIYRGVRLKSKYYLDFVVEGLVPAELKSVEMLLGVHKKQLLSQLRLTNLPVGLLLNFNVEVLTAGGVKRIVNSRYRSEAGSKGTKATDLDERSNEATEGERRH
jgi:GxxExxY protein